MPPPPQTVEGGGILQKMGMGAAMGGTVGLTIGFIFGGFSILRAGPGPRGVLATMSQYMLSSAATFGFFMSIGSVIRTDSPYSLPAHQRFQPQLVTAALRSQMTLASGSGSGERDVWGKSSNWEVEVVEGERR